MLRSLKVPFYRWVVRKRLEELAYSASPRQLRGDLGRRLTQICLRAEAGGWTSRTAAAVLVAIWIGRRARELDPKRRMRVGQRILEREQAGLTALDWLEEFDTDRMNIVGTDVVLMRYNFALGILSSWIVDGKAVDRGTRRILVAMAAWGLAGLPEAEIESRLDGLLGDLDRER